MTIDADLMELLTIDADIKPFGDFMADQATFVDTVDFARCEFRGETSFEYAEFQDLVSFDRAEFKRIARFQGARFEQGASFRDVGFTAMARFGKCRFAAANFAGATFGEGAWFVGARFEGTAFFTGIQAPGPMMYTESSFAENVDFTRAMFHDTASFERCEFTKHAEFTRCLHEGMASFVSAAFTDAVTFDHSTFEEEARFDNATMRAGGDFNAVRFARSVWFANIDVPDGQLRCDRSTFGDQVHLTGARCAVGLWLSYADLALASDLGPMVAGALVLDGATFERRTRIRVRTRQVVAVDTRFLDGVNLQTEGTEVILDGVLLGGPSSLVATGPNTSATRLLSLHRVDVSNLTLVDVDLRACRFAGTHNLDKIRIEGACQLAGTPVSRFGRRWTRRQTLAEEHVWRADSRHGGQRWRRQETELPSWVTDRTGNSYSSTTPDQLASLYRALRKASEDAKNEPGAADFYYGEMEMRRFSRTTPAAERAILHTYWLVSGYGLRAWRAATLLLVMLAVYGALLFWFGFEAGHSRGYWQSQVYALNALGFNPDRSIVLTMPGQLTQISLRVLGTLLAGLTLLAVRNRIKR